MKDFLSDYIQEQKKALASIDLQQVEKLIAHFRQALLQDRQVFVFGNGGSAANASHMITDLGKGASDKTFRPFRCLSLNDNTSWMTAIGNDYAYEDIFARQLRNYARPGDTALMMSVSGNSPNLVKAAEWCKQQGIFIAALVGAKKGRLSELADQTLVIDSFHYGCVEDCHMHICHMICYAFMELAELQVPAP